MGKQYFTFWVFILILNTPTLTGQNTGFLFEPDLKKISSTLASAKESEDESTVPIEITLPNHAGVFSTYKVFKSSVLSKEMEEAYPDFMTYSIAGKDHSLAYGRIFISRFGLEGVIMFGSYRIKIEPVDKNNPKVHRVYLLELNESFTCGTDEEAKIIKGQFSGLRSPNGGTRRQYEMALVCTGEFYQSAAFGQNNDTIANAAVVNIINLINIYWNSEMSIQITIFSTPAIYTNPANDPFDPSSSSTLTTQAASAIHSNFPSGAYDIGHALHALVGGGSGVAGVGVVCNTSASGTGFAKSRGWSSGNSVNMLAVKIMVHEVGHQFNSPHTFNGSLVNCNTGQHSLNTAYEIGSGTTIMSYAGICGGHNIQSTQDLYFHSKSLELFYNYVTSTSGNCSTNFSTGNTPPAVDATICSGTYTIPVMTPFELTGSGSDPDGDVVTYTWEQTNEDGAGARPTHGFLGSTAGNSNNAPLFRSYPPTTSGFKRTFPNLTLVAANNYTSNFEPLPNASRTLNFRLTARDVRSPYAAYQYDNIAVTVDATKGPLTVTAPNTNVTIAAGTSSTITWTVNNTNTICNTVNILLSVDGGITYPYTLLSNTTNDGTQSVTFLSNIPPSISARIRVESNCLSCLKFFDISDVNFTITSSCNVAASNICNSAPLTAQEGNSALNLGLNVSYGQSFSSQGMVPSGAGVVSALHSGTTPGSGGCTTANFGDSPATLRFKPSVTGNYTFNMTGGFSHVTIYNGEYNSAQPCTNFLGSTAYNGGAVQNPIVLNLSSCNIYTAVFFDVAGTAGTLTITPPSGGATFVHNPPVNPNYSLTYAAVNTTNNTISAVSATSNFTSLLVGNYCVYALYYYSGTANPPVFFNPVTFVGQTLSSLTGNGVCYQASSNCKPITVTQICSTSVTSTADDGPGTLRRAVTCNTENTLITFNSSVTQINLTSLLNISKNMTLQGISPTIRPTINTHSTGINISTGKVLSLQNVDIRYMGVQTLSGGGTLNITGTTLAKQ
ncbi:MAG: hypothetical protein IPL20_14930 [Saprospiraceae bacterium]|nr:hypothetical protein [Saprospiraceae bacterium]